MLVEYYFPQSLSPSRLDRYLAGGWFRSGSSLFRAQVLCLDGEAHSVVNIRSHLENFKLSKSLRRVFRQNQKQFRVEYGLAGISPAKERLYNFQKKRFKGFIFDTLEEFLFGGESEHLFDTRELRVYDGEKLIACSFFDLGNKSIASLMGLHDPAYRKASLGVYTMILEIQYALRAGLKYYYPGYILKDFGGFDYKLRMGNVQYYNWQGYWRPFERLEVEKFILPDIKQKILEVEGLLTHRSLPYHRLLYPFFAIGYLSMVEESFIKSIMYLRLDAAVDSTESEREMVIEYNPEENRFFLSWVRPNADYVDFLNAKFSENFFKGQVFDKGLLVRDRLLYSDKNPKRVVDKACHLLEEHSDWLIA